jgi:hypothetical protein
MQPSALEITAGDFALAALMLHPSTLREGKCHGYAAPALFNAENELIKEEIAVHREIAEEYGEQSTNRLRGVMERDDLMRRLQWLNGERM